ncbi:MAG: Spy/CpxP family protein refolding chaperone [Bacteroidales bacterium]|nr:Spy/CpxP family protein refolding chaperone [Bacteroidales bacterium]MDZ4204161.1 Spy/CpxP family protein refolding chaperone [Bacteroidales bacterium]
MKAMKLNRIFLTPALLAVLLLLSSQLVAQPERGFGPRFNKMANDENVQPPRREFCKNLPNLNDEQMEQIKSIRLKTTKDTQKFHNEIGEKQARLHTLSTTDNADMKAINKTIDEIATLRAEVQRTHMAQRQAIRKLLNDEQRIMFDSRPRGTRGFAAGHKGAKGKGACCPGKCPYKK